MLRRFQIRRYKSAEVKFAQLAIRIGLRDLFHCISKQLLIRIAHDTSRWQAEYICETRRSKERRGWWFFYISLYIMIRVIGSHDWQRYAACFLCAEAYKKLRQRRRRRFNESRLISGIRNSMTNNPFHSNRWIDFNMHKCLK